MFFVINRIYRNRSEVRKCCDSAINNAIRCKPKYAVVSLQRLTIQHRLFNFMLCVSSVE